MVNICDLDLISVWVQTEIKTQNKEKFPYIPDHGIY